MEDLSSILGLLFILTVQQRGQAQVEMGAIAPHPRLPADILKFRNISFSTPFLDFFLNLTSSTWGTARCAPRLIPLDAFAGLCIGCLSTRSFLKLYGNSEKGITPKVMLRYLFSRLARGKRALMFLGAMLFLTPFTIAAQLSLTQKLPVASPSEAREHETVLYFLKYYTKPYCRYGPFLVGMLLGIFKHHNDQANSLKSKFYLFSGHCFLTFTTGLVLTMFIEKPFQERKQYLLGAVSTSHQNE
ncbi:O-acyltransferase like protein-like isoform X2 [Petaurus breviceps papuanus]|uniref:O-acyltransferase like protein-like isoform X2 n=1 Tax=Petaurus breviceps papuanus TaxID=3040969 RepID=UPI0036DA1F6A